MIYPRIIVILPPNSDLPVDIQSDYLEAAKILHDSPRASAALLRLALQKLCKFLGGEGKNINQDIGYFVKEKHLDPTVQKAMDALRITGNFAVHPGEIDLQEDPAKVLTLFQLINFIAEQLISKIKVINEIYNGLPAGLREAVDIRDGVGK